MHGGFMLPDMVTLLPTIPPLIMISGFFAIVWDLFGPLFNIVIRFFELVPLLFNPAQLANEIITGTSVGLVMIIEKVMGFFNPAKYGPDAKPYTPESAMSRAEKNCYSTSFMNLVLLIICPPFAVFQALGFSFNEIFLCTLLTIYGYYFPGLLYAIILTSSSMKSSKNKSGCKK